MSQTGDLCLDLDDKAELEEKPKYGGHESLMQGRCIFGGPLLDPNLQPLLSGQPLFSQHPAHLSFHSGATRLCVQLLVADWKGQWPK